MAERKQRSVRPRLRACLVYWDPEKERYRITSPKTAQSAKKMADEQNYVFDSVFLMTDLLESQGRQGHRQVPRVPVIV